MHIFDVIIIFAAGLSIMMALGLAVRPLSFRNVILAITLALMAYLTMSLYLLHSKQIYEYPLLFLGQVPVVMIIGPFLYFYVLSISGDKDGLSKRDILHFIPVILVVLYLMPYFLYSPNTQQQIIYEMLEKERHIPLRAIFTGAVFLPVIYISLPLVRIVLKIRKATTIQKKMILLIALLVLWSLTGIAGIGGTIALSFSFLKGINLFVCAVIFCFYLLGQRYPYLLQFGTVPAKIETQGKSYLAGIDLDILEKQISSIMEEEKIYCDEDLSLPRLSGALGISTHQLSQFLNQYYNKNFNSFVNGYRIEEAKRILVEEPSRNTLSVAEAVGFNSYSAFHGAFKKETGFSPAEYRRKELRVSGQVTQA